MQSLPLTTLRLQDTLSSAVGERRAETQTIFIQMHRWLCRSVFNVEDHFLVIASISIGQLSMS